MILFGDEASFAQWGSLSYTGRFNSDSYKACLTEVLAKTSQPLIIIQNGAPYHTSQAMQESLLRYFANLPKKITNLMGKYCKPLGTDAAYGWTQLKIFFLKTIIAGVEGRSVSKAHKTDADLQRPHQRFAYQLRRG